MRASLIRKNLGLILPLSLFYGALWACAHAIAFFYFQVPVGTAAQGFVAGFFIWTLSEYGLHRYVLHNRKLPSGVHDWHGHIFHHRTPSNPEEITFPITGSFPVFLAFAALLWLVSWNAALFVCLLAGFICGYLCYEWIHFGAHYHLTANPFLKLLYLNHRRHHHEHEARFFGTTTPIWDLLFKTWRRPAHR